MGSVKKFSGQAWVAVGDIANWERGLENGIWGIVPQLEHNWQRADRDDLVLFYCMNPIKKFFGAGIIRNKFIQTKPLWKEELQDNKVIWPFRFEFDVLSLIPLDYWKSKGIMNADYNLSVMGGLNPVKDYNKAINILERLSPYAEETVKGSQDISAVLCEIGRIQRMVVETNIPVEENYLDVVWKRVIRSVPTFSFAINLKGTLEPSIASLKHAHDYWNSRPYLVVEPSRVHEVNEITGGLYHEFSRYIKVLDTNQIHELYSRKKAYFDLEERYGLR